MPPASSIVVVRRRHAAVRRVADVDRGRAVHNDRRVATVVAATVAALTGPRKATVPPTERPA